MAKFADVGSEVLNVSFKGANEIDAWMQKLPRAIRGAIGGALLHHGKKMATAMNMNEPRTSGLGKYWINRSFKLADSIRPEAVYVQDLGTSIFVHVTCDSTVYNQYGRIILHRPRRRSQDIFYADAEGKSPVDMVLEEFKPGLVKDVGAAAKLAVDATMRRI